MHLTSSSIAWYAARAGGVAGYVLLTCSVLLGLAMSGGKRLAGWPRFALEDVHRFTGRVVAAFLVIHVGAIAIDSYMPFSLTGLVLPLAARYRPVWTGTGIASLELLAALGLANRFRDRIGRRLWRRTHYLSFLVWIGATIHGIGSGTDRSTPWLLTLELTCAALVAGATAWRVVRGRGSAALRRGLPAGVALAALAFVLALVLATPVRHAHRAPDAVAFSDTLQGRLIRDTGQSRALISLAGTGAGRQRVMLRADLLVAPGTVLSTDFQMEYLPGGAVCRGTVTKVRGYGFDARCRLASGARRRVHASWSGGEGTTIGGGHLRAEAA